MLVAASDAAPEIVAATASGTAAAVVIDAAFGVGALVTTTEPGVGTIVAISVCAFTMPTIAALTISSVTIQKSSRLSNIRFCIGFLLYNLHYTCN
jgi:hypothetical protein